MIFRSKHAAIIWICPVHILSTQILYILSTSDNITVISIYTNNHSQGFASKSWVKILKLMLFPQVIFNKNFNSIIIHIYLLPMTHIPLKHLSRKIFCQEGILYLCLSKHLSKHLSPSIFQMKNPQLHHIHNTHLGWYMYNQHQLLIQVNLQGDTR